MSTTFKSQSSIWCLSLFFALVSITGCANTAETSTTIAPVFEVREPCSFEATSELPPERVTCGYLSVAENRSDPSSSILRLPVAIIHSLHEQPKADPVVFLTGGPGAAPTTSAATFQLFSEHAFGKDRDIIIYTQRGGLMSEPALRCDDLLSARVSIYAKDQTLAERDAEIADLVHACLVELKNSGRDLSSYSAAENARDLIDMRQALGIEQFNLLAVSYGTLIAVEVARLDPNGTRSMTLDSVVSPGSDVFISEASRNFANGMERLLDACGSDSACNNRFPTLRESLDRVMSDLAEEPVTVMLAGPADSLPLEMVVNWHDFLGLTHWMLYNSRTLTWIPLLIDETAKGRIEFLTHLMGRVFPAPANATDDAAGTFFAVVCRDQYATRGPARLTDDRYSSFSITSFMGQACSNPELDYERFTGYAPLKSDVPTLLLSGRFDPMTPDIYAENILDGLSNASLIRVANFGHSTLSGYTACQTEAAAAFLNDLSAKDEYPCLADIKGPQFATSVAEILAALSAQ